MLHRQLIAQPVLELGLRACDSLNILAIFRNLHIRHPGSCVLQAAQKPSCGRLAHILGGRLAGPRVRSVVGVYREPEPGDVHIILITVTLLMSCSH